MTKKNIKKIIISSVSIFLLLVIVLVVHIYIVTRPRMDATTRVMARIDIKQDISQEEAGTITAWLYAQQGVDRVMINPETDIIIFTFFPVQTNANEIVRKCKSQFNLSKAERFMPTKDQLNNGCPVAANSLTYKIYKFFN